MIFERENAFIRINIHSIELKGIRKTVERSTSEGNGFAEYRYETPEIYFSDKNRSHLVVWSPVK